MSASGKSFTFNSIDFGGASYNLYVYARTLPRLPRPRVNIDNFAQTDGAATQGSTFDDSRITLECAITGSTTANVETLVANAMGQLAKSQEGAKTLILDSHSTKAYTARLVSAVDGRLGLNGETFTLEFHLGNPWPEATSETELGDTSNDGGGITNI